MSQHRSTPYKILIQTPTLPLRPNPLYNLYSRPWLLAPPLAWFLFPPLALHCCGDHVIIAAFRFAQLGIFLSNFVLFTYKSIKVTCLFTFLYPGRVDLAFTVEGFNKLNSVFSTGTFRFIKSNQCSFSKEDIHPEFQGQCNHRVA